MIFHEWYSAYYNAVAGIIKAATDHPVGREEIRKIVADKAFGESILTIEPALMEERWQVLEKDGTTRIKNPPDMPLTKAQKRWINAISLDPRIRLFCDEPIRYPDAAPLFTPDDIAVFDKYEDGDDYEDETYRNHFRLILDAIKNHYPIKIKVDNRSGRMTKKIILPKYLEYSEKDDKFRLIASGKPSGGTYNLGRIRSCEPFTGDYKEEEMRQRKPSAAVVIFELYDRRNALERVLLHFAHFEKEVERVEEEKYRVTIRYEEEDETELVIRILSFGPMIRVLEPEGFVDLIKKRLREQKSCGL